MISRVLPALCVMFLLVHEADAEEAATPQPKILRYVIERTLTLAPNGPVKDGNEPWIAHVSLNARSLPHIEDGQVVAEFGRGDQLAGSYLRVMESDEEWLEIERHGVPAYVSRIGLTRPHPTNLAAIEKSGNLPVGTEIVNRWWGLPIAYEPDDMVDLPPRHCLEPQPAEADRSEGGRLMVRAEAAKSLVSMLDAMAEAGVAVYVSSAYRSGASQRRIYLSATRRRPSQRGTAPPGHSEHQLGTTVDFSTEKAARRSLRNTDEAHQWMSVNAAGYGWHQTYRADNRDETGYIEEPWHWRYLGTPESR